MRNRTHCEAFCLALAWITKLLKHFLLSSRSDQTSMIQGQPAEAARMSSLPEVFHSREVAGAGISLKRKVSLSLDLGFSSLLCPLMYFTSIFANGF